MMEDNTRAESFEEKENANTKMQALKKEECILDHMEICVTEAEKRETGALNIRDFYTVYLIETKVTDLDWNGTLNKLSSLWRRYSEFELLRTYLEVTYPYIVVPPLPEKKVIYAWQKIASDTFDPDFVDRRRAGLENFLLRVASHPILSFDQQFIGFLQQEEGWGESIKDTGYLQLAESKLKALSVSVRLKQPDKRFEAIKNYGNELQNNLGNLLRVRARLVERLYGIHKLHANYGRVFSEWSAKEKEMGDGLQRAGHYLDSLAAGIDMPLEEEELYADQLKEYLFFAGALQAVCRRQEMLQLQLEKAEAQVLTRTIEKDNVQKGKSGLMSRLFGSVDTEEVRELKVNLLDQRIQEGKDGIHSAQEELSEFSKQALIDIERFQQQKISDLRETLTGYVILQIKMCRKGLQTWTHIRDCLEAIP
ncbi:Sorting nexin-4 [Cryptotermes secundus]|uniref:Sorting nexin-4 n=1 Tax=Cryptotermes secundus TaxID=105785 RepID=A0A2J7RK00_9NEOP|nr:sorting nexin-4 [Cryptotermes secundus]PNF41162.1 Sorting nexin-4 [Cryptotermes secundus]